MAIFHQLTEFCPNSCESSLRKISDGLPLPRPGDEESKCHRHSTLVEKSVEESRHSLHERQFHQNKALLSSISCRDRGQNRLGRRSAFFPVSREMTMADKKHPARTAEVKPEVQSTSINLANGLPVGCRLGAVRPPIYPFGRTPVDAPVERQANYVGVRL